MEEDMENNELSKNTCQLEEDIKILEDVLKDRDTKLESLIARYKELEKINNKYKVVKTLNEIQEYEIKENSIPKSKVLEKIEELKVKPNKFYSENKKFYYETDAYNKIIIQTLEELLED